MGCGFERREPFLHVGTTFFAWRYHVVIMDVVGPTEAATFLSSAKSDISPTAVKLLGVNLVFGKTEEAGPAF